MSIRHRFAFPLTVLAAAMLAIFRPAMAEEGEEVSRLITPTSTVSVGAGYLFNENTQWGKFTGMTENKVYGLFDLHLVNRNDETGTWLRVDAWNLGMSDREFRFEQNRQGNWGYFLDYSQIPFNQPLTVITRTSGIGTTVQDPDGLPTAIPTELGTRRDRFTVGVSKALGMGFDFSARVRSETKEGTRRWGSQASAGFNAFNFLAEPIDWTTNQLDAVFGYTGEKLQILAGYYGTSFDNANTKVSVGGLGAPANVSLPPDNQSHQAYLSGGYNFTPGTRGNFKVSYTSYSQNEAFYVAPNPPAGSLATGRGSLDGDVQTFLAEAGIVSRPLPKLTLRADWRYEDRDDKTPRLQYVSAAASRDGFNVPLSRTTTIARAEAQYLLPMGFRAVAGLEFDSREREITPTRRQISWRADTDEWSYRLEINRSLSETLNGRLSYIHSSRTGSPYLLANNNANADVIDPIHWADRDRDKARLRLDWVPVEELSVQLTVDRASDSYDGRPLGPESGGADFYGLDATYVISDKWQVVGWLSQGTNEIDQRTIGAAARNPAISGNVATARQTWYAGQRYTTEAAGVGLRARPLAKLEVGADLQYQHDKEEYNVIATSGPLPDIKTTHSMLTLFGKYAINANSGVKVEYTYDRWKTNDWAWQVNPFAVFNPSPPSPNPNGTQVYFDSPQTVNFVGASYYYEWR